MAYSQQERYDLLHNTDKFIKEHPTKTLNQIATLKRYHLKKGTTVEQEPNPTANQTNLRSLRRDS